MEAGYQNTNRVAYNASISLTFLVKGMNINIASERIKYIVIDTNYETEIMPKIYINVSVDTSLFNYITNYKDTGKFKLKIQRKNLFSKTSLADVIVNDSFSYIPSTTNSDYLKDLSEGGVRDDSYRNITIGLISDKIINNLRKTFNSIYNNIDQETLVSIATEGLNIITKPLEYNNKYESILVPPITTRHEFIKYIFEYDNFYNSNFLFFMDFNRSYLLSRDGQGIYNSDDPINDVFLDIKGVSNQSAFYDGMNIMNNSYYLYINPANSNVIIPDSMGKLVNRLIVVDDDKDLEVLDLALNENYDSGVRDMFVRADNGSVIKNELEQQNVLVEITKNLVDGYSFTPNKNYMVNNFGSYAKYNGKYLLSGKKEYFRVTADGDFYTSCYLILRKVGTIASKNNTESLDRSNRAVKASSQYTTTSDKINTTKITQANRTVD
jgi:hypothetical protein